MRKPTLAEKWAKVAEEVRAIAMRAGNPVTKETMLEIAAGYDWLAKKSEEASPPEMADLKLTPHEFHGEWNYTIGPRSPP
jgi:hypothetical protein